MLENNIATTNYSGKIDLSVLRKKRFLIDDDESRVLELNTSDLSIITRLSESYPKLEKLSTAISAISSGEDITEDTVQDDLAKMSELLSKIDNEMREQIDYIFDSNVSEVCVPSGSMYDPINGQLRYEHLINILIGLYEDNLSKEMKRVQKRVKSHTDKYTG